MYSSGKISETTACSCGKTSYMNTIDHLRQNPGTDRTFDRAFMPLRDMDKAIIQKQRQELQLLIAELKERDQELNSMVSVQQEQQRAWERDRLKALSLERRCVRLEGELDERKELIRLLCKRLKTMEAENEDSRREVSCTQLKLQDLYKTHQLTRTQHQDLQGKTLALNSTIQALTSQVSQLQGQEQELRAQLEQKDKDKAATSNHLSKRVCEQMSLLREARSCLGVTHRGLEEWKRRAREAEHEAAQLKDELLRKTAECSREESLIRLTVQNEMLRMELAASGECKSHKDDLPAIPRAECDSCEDTGSEDEVTDFTAVLFRDLDTDTSTLLLNIPSHDPECSQCSCQSVGDLTVPSSTAHPTQSTSPAPDDDPTQCLATSVEQGAPASPTGRSPFSRRQHNLHQRLAASFPVRE